MKLLSPRQIRSLLGDTVPLRTIQYYLETGALKGRKVAGRWRVNYRDVQRFFGVKEEGQPDEPAGPQKERRGRTSRPRIQLW